MPDWFGRFVVARSRLPRASVVVLWLVCVVALGVSSPAVGSAVPGRPPGRSPDARALRALGVRVAWPLHRAAVSLAPGTRLVTQVRGVGHKHHAAVALALVRVDPQGRTLQRLATTKLTRGSFVVRLPRTAGAHYALTLQAGRLRYRAWIDTPAVLPPPAKPPALPPGPRSDDDPQPAVRCGPRFSGLEA